MKALRKTSPIFLALSLAVLASAWTVAAAQKRDLRVVSARAGGVNYVLGDVKFRRRDAAEWKTLTTDETLDNGDSVRVGRAAVVEVLLNPGSYLRAGGGTEFEMVDASLDELKLRVSRGSVIVEALGYEDSELDIRVSTPQTETSIARTGIYRFNVKPEGLTEVVVEKGRALVGAGLAAVVVKGGKVVRARAGVPAEIVKLDKKTRDELDLWSRERGRDLAEANSRISRRNANTLLASYRSGDIFSRSFGGFWYYDARRGCYTFMPFYGGWSSPYGTAYATSLYWYDRCYGCNTYGTTDDWWKNSSAGTTPRPNPAPVQETPRVVNPGNTTPAIDGWNKNKDVGVKP